MTTIHCEACGYPVDDPSLSTSYSAILNLLRSCASTAATQLIDETTARRFRHELQHLLQRSLGWVRYHHILRLNGVKEVKLVTSHPFCRSTARKDSLNYSSAVKDPIDLTMIEKKLREGKYVSNGVPAGGFSYQELAHEVNQAILAFLHDMCRIRSNSGDCIPDDMARHKTILAHAMVNFFETLFRMELEKWLIESLSATPLVEAMLSTPLLQFLCQHNSFPAMQFIRDHNIIIGSDISKRDISVNIGSLVDVQVDNGEYLQCGRVLSERGDGMYDIVTDIGLKSTHRKSDVRLRKNCKSDEVYGYSYWQNLLGEGMIEVMGIDTSSNASEPGNSLGACDKEDQMDYRENTYRSEDVPSLIGAEEIASMLSSAGYVTTTHEVHFLTSGSSLINSLPNLNFTEPSSPTMPRLIEGNDLAIAFKLEPVDLNSFCGLITKRTDDFDLPPSSTNSLDSTGTYKTNGRARQMSSDGHQLGMGPLDAFSEEISEKGEYVSRAHRDKDDPPLVNANSEEVEALSEKGSTPPLLPSKSSQKLTTSLETHVECGVHQDSNKVDVQLKRKASEVNSSTSTHSPSELSNGRDVERPLKSTKLNSSIPEDTNTGELRGTMPSIERLASQRICDESISNASSSRIGMMKLGDSLLEIDKKNSKVLHQVQDSNSSDFDVQRPSSEKFCVDAIDPVLHESTELDAFEGPSPLKNQSTPDFFKSTAICADSQDQDSTGSLSENGQIEFPLDSESQYAGTRRLEDASETANYGEGAQVPRENPGRGKKSHWYYVESENAWEEYRRRQRELRRKNPAHIDEPFDIYSERLARQPQWKCQSCGKENLAIMRKCEQCNTRKVRVTYSELSKIGVEGLGIEDDESEASGGESDEESDDSSVELAVKLTCHNQRTYYLFI